MKRLLIVGALAAASAFTFSFGAHAATACPAGDTVNNSNPAGVVCAGGDPAAQQGHIYADGNDTYGGPSGYIGANDSEGVVGCWTGDYAEGSNNVILDPMNPPTSPPAPGGACDPSAP